MDHQEVRRPCSRAAAKKGRGSFGWLADGDGWICQPASCTSFACEGPQDHPKSPNVAPWRLLPLKASMLRDHRRPASINDVECCRKTPIVPVVPLDSDMAAVIALHLHTYECRKDWRPGVLD